MNEEVVVDEKFLGEVITDLVKSFDDDLYSKTNNELKEDWYWNWNPEHSVKYNTYKFFDMLSMYQRICRRWEEKHNGITCVVERVRDKYLMPKIPEFLEILENHFERSSSDFRDYQENLDEIEK